jgi:uncharacterized damage-inducible protein DinB
VWPGDPATGHRAQGADDDTVRTNTILTAEEIPESDYGFRATPESRTVAEILSHIATVTRSSYQAHAVKKIKTFAGVDFAVLLRQRQELEQQLQTKAQILESLRGDGEAWASFLDGVSEEALADVLDFPSPAEPPSKSRFEMFLSLKEHEMHHRAQLMVIERLLGIVPHLTRQRQARLAQLEQHTRSAG